MYSQLLKVLPVQPPRRLRLLVVCQLSGSSSGLHLHLLQEIGILLQTEAGRQAHRQENRVGLMTQTGPCVAEEAGGQARRRAGGQALPCCHTGWWGR